MSATSVPANFQKLSVPQRIKYLRKQAGSHDRLAAKVGTTRQVIIRWEQGTNAPSAESRRRLAEVSGLPPAAFNENGDEDDEDSELAGALLIAVRAILRAEREKVIA